MTRRLLFVTLAAVLLVTAPLLAAAIAAVLGGVSLLVADWRSMRGAERKGEQCPAPYCCRDCDDALDVTFRRMMLCPKCGNKRCPKASNHGNTCTGSNEPGQPGSRYLRLAGTRTPSVARASGTGDLSPDWGHHPQGG